MRTRSPRDPLLATEIRVTSTLALIFGLRMFGLFLLLPVFSLLGASLEGSTPALIGTAIGVYGLLQAALQIPFGMLSDRVGRRPVILGGLILFVAGGVVAALSSHIHGVILGRALQGAGAIAGVIMALVGDTVSDQRRTRAMATIGMAVGGAFVLALVLGPVIARGLGLSGMFWGISGLGALALMVAWWRVPRGASSTAAAMRSPLPVWQLLWHPQLWRFHLGIFSLHLVMTATFVVVPVMLREQLGLALSAHSLLYLGVMVGGVVAMVPLVIRADRQRAVPVLRFGIVLLCLAEALLAVAQPVLWWFVLALLVFFTAFNLLEALFPSLVGRAIPAGARGAAMGVYSSSQFLGVFAGAQLGGWLLGSGGAELVLGLCAALAGAWGLLTIGMQELPKLESRVFPLASSREAPDLEALLAVPGVEEGVLVPEDGVVVVRINTQKLDENALNVWLGSRAQQG